VSVLYIVATPIGNLEDITLRAVRVLGEVEMVLAEDTRRTRVLLDRHGIDARTSSLHAHNEASRIDRVLSALEAGGDVALVSDAGTPLISDPGERLVAAVAREGYDISPVPGASAVSSALSVSGLAAVPYSFVGFLPRRRGECERLLTGLRDRPDTLVFFESPRRVAATLKRLAEVLGNRQACAARELTKRHEEVARGSLEELSDRFSDTARGEFTLVVAGATPAPPITDPTTRDPRIRTLLTEGATPREISNQLATETGLPKRTIYTRTIEIKNTLSPSRPES
jgi:16S rRNA (cytidine1402-2'-O)-methyltransferase